MSDPNSTSDETRASGSGLPPAPPSVAPLDPELPARIGRFQVKSLLGEGAYGRVYLALDADLDRLVAIKVPKFVAMTDELRERFLREARATAKIEHPNVCPILEIGTDGELPFFVMLYLAGTTLSAHLEKRKVLAPHNAVALTQRLALGISAAHEKGVIHRDLKPQNILFDPEKQRAIITDFGLARIGASSQQTAVGTVFGTPFYMSPEQARGETNEIGPLSDVYSLGVILYRMLTGVLPFTGSVYEVLLQHCETLPVPPSVARGGLDARLDALCLKAMEKRPQDRYPSARAFAEALALFLRGGSNTVDLDADETLGSRSEITVPPIPPPASPPLPSSPGASTGKVGASGTRSNRRAVPPPLPAPQQSGTRSGSKPPRAVPIQPEPEPGPQQQPFSLDDESEDRRGSLRAKVLIGGIAFLFLSVFVLVGVLVVPQLRKQAQNNPPVEPDPVVPNPPDLPPDPVLPKPPGPNPPNPNPPPPKIWPTAANGFAGHAFDQATERRVAAWVLSVGGTVQIVSKEMPGFGGIAKGIGARRPITRVEELPAEFTVALIELRYKPELTDEVFAANVGGLSGPVQVRIRECEQLSDESLKVLSRIPKLTGLHLYRLPRVTNAGLVAFAGHPTLEHLTLEKTGVTRDGIKAVAKLPAIAALDIDTEDPNAWLADLTPLANLHDLTLHARDETQFTERGLPRLKAFKKLTRLALDGRNVTDEWLAEIAELGTLVRLDLVDARIFGPGFVHLKKVPGLKVLILGESLVRDEGMTHLAECPALEELDLTGTFVGDDGLRALHKSGTLRKLVVLRTNVSAKGVRDLEKELPKCQVLASEN